MEGDTTGEEGNAGPQERDLALMLSSQALAGLQCVRIAGVL